MKDINVLLKFRNNLIFQTCKEKFGDISPFKTAEELGVCYQTFLNLLNFRTSPVMKKRKWGKPTEPALDGNYWKPISLKIAKGLNLSPFALFPEYLWPKRKNSFELELDSQELISLNEALELPSSDDNPEQTALIKQENAILHKLLTTLTPRQEQILKARFGIGEEAKTMRQIGSQYGISRERVRQIEARGLRKLRHLPRVAHLEARIT